MDVKFDVELFLRGLAAYYGMNIVEFNNLIDGSYEKLMRFYDEYKRTHP